MAANFERWEQDPFFSAAEEVQESADRMESMYRTWLHSMKETSSSLSRGDLRRDLSTAVDTAKWQLEEFERAVQSSYSNIGTDEAKDRHRQFVIAMEGKISEIKKSLQESATLDGKSSSPWLQFDEGESDELALFLSGPKVEVKEGRHSGHRRTASADIASWNVTIGEDEVASGSSNGLVKIPPRVPSFSSFVGTMESVPKLKLLKNGFRKWNPSIRQHEDDAALLRSHPQSRGSHLCYDKQLHGWHGALHRRLQRSLYQVQQIRSVQMTYWVGLLIFSVGGLQKIGASQGLSSTSLELRVSSATTSLSLGTR